MSTLDYVILAVVAVWFFLAMRNILKKKGGCCSGGCSGCSSCKKQGCSVKRRMKKKWQ